MENHDVRANPRMGGRAPNPIHHSILEKKVQTLAALVLPIFRPHFWKEFFFREQEFGRCGGERHKRVWLTGLCFFAGIPRFLTITTSLLEAGALRPPAFSQRLLMGRSRLRLRLRLNMSRMVKDENIEFGLRFLAFGWHTKNKLNSFWS